MKETLCKNELNKECFFLSLSMWVKKNHKVNDDQHFHLFSFFLLNNNNWLSFGALIAVLITLTLYLMRCTRLKFDYSHSSTRYHSHTHTHRHKNNAEPGH